ncbi:hypothetical protein ACVW1A_001478 [Bradyrhizobium sp. LB1.3]|uniref:hypothetical protein n=1 Tax=unclassified Bradyrhizobium TaxID=2631580 RepID=UPI001FF8A3F4|nr:hypothetical protein [Bradyrhizobium sp. 197]MCK1478835.1 hypothetical protein [Bradyrhizobium sp. 197]
MSRRIEDIGMAAESKRFGYERSDVSMRLVVWLAAGLATFVVVTPLVLPLIFPQSRTRTTPASRPALSSNVPPLEVAPRKTLQIVRHDEEQLTRDYGWTDRSRGTVRIPVDRAIDILLRKGLPGWPSP